MKLFLMALLSICPLLYSSSMSKHQITYLMQAGEVSRSINLYRSWKDELEKHDPEILQQMALILLDVGARSGERENQLLSIFGSGIAGVASSLDILEAGIKSQHAETQVASIQYLGRLQDDRSDDLLLKAMGSPFFFVRIEAALQLAARKHPASVGQIESLMYRIPPPFRFFFPQFFALIGTNDAISILRHLMEDRYATVRVESILSAARFGRDDLLPSIRACLTHQNVAEQEAAIYAVGLLRDSKSHKRLEAFLKSPHSHIQIAAALSLLELGDVKGKELLLQKAKENDVFAISALGNVHEGADLLFQKTKSADPQIRLNATVALMKLRDTRAAPLSLELILNDSRDLGFIPQLSLGKSQMAWKRISSKTQHQKNEPYDLFSSTMMLKEQLLTQALELPEEVFLHLSRLLFETGQSEHIPLLVHLLENMGTERSAALLKKMATAAGKPLARAWCTLALYRMKVEGPWEENVIGWALKNDGEELIRFRPVVPIDQRVSRTPFELTPEDQSRLLVDTFSTIADRHEPAGIDLLLNAIQNGNPKNRYVLAGLLLRALE